MGIQNKLQKYHLMFSKWMKKLLIIHLKRFVFENLINCGLIREFKETYYFLNEIVIGYHILGLACASSNNFQDTQQILAQVIIRNKDFCFAYFDLGMVYANLGNYEAAEANFSNAVNLDQKNEYQRGKHIFFYFDLIAYLINFVG